MRTNARFVGVVALVLGLLALAPVPAQAAVLVDDVPTAGWGVNGRVYASTVVGDTVFLGGTFTSAVSPSGALTPRRNLAAFSLSTGQLLPWRADAGAAVRALTSDGASLYVGGSFGAIGGVSRVRIAKVDVATAAVDRGFTASADNTVRGLSLSGGSLYAGGAFLNVNGVARTRLAKLDATDGSLDATFTASANNTVFSVAKNPATDVLYASGLFSSLGSAARNGVGAVDATTGVPTGTVFASAARPTLGLVTDPDGTRLFGAGGSGSNAAAAWNTSTGARVWRQVTDGDIQAIDYYDNTVYFGFHDGYQGDPTIKMLAANADTGQLQGFYPRFNDFWGVFAISAGPGGVVAGGEFTTVSGTPARNAARFEPLGAPAPEPVEDRYVDSTSTWRYWDANSRPADWQLLSFDDSGWQQGLSQLGYGDGDEQTVIRGGSVTAYFRTSFTLDLLNGPRPDVVTLELAADDGAVVYLNGVQQTRDNMPTGTITHTTLASTARTLPGQENALRPFSINPAQLRNGKNVLAVEVHQAGAASDDLTLDADLIGKIVPADANQSPTAAFTATPDVNLGASFDASGSSDPDGSVASYTWDFGDGTPPQRTTAATTAHTFPAAGGYPVTLRVTDDGGATGTVTHTVTALSPTLSQDVVSNGSTWSWRWLPTTPASGWNDVGFDTSTWHADPAVLGWGATVTTDIRTLEPYAEAARPRAVYLTRSFSVADTTKARSLTLRTVANDGVVVYVNGVEVARRNMPAGTPTVDTLATAAPGTGTANASPLVVDVPLALLRAGSNVVAAETHVRSRTTTDVSFDLRATLVSAR